MQAGAGDGVSAASRVRAVVPRMAQRGWTCAANVHNGMDDHIVGRPSLHGRPRPYGDDEEDEDDEEGGGDDWGSGADAGR